MKKTPQTKGKPNGKIDNILPTIWYYFKLQLEIEPMNNNVGKENFGEVIPLNDKEDLITTDYLDKFTVVASRDKEDGVDVLEKGVRDRFNWDLVLATIGTQISKEERKLLQELRVGEKSTFLAFASPLYNVPVSRKNHQHFHR